MCVLSGQRPARPAGSAEATPSDGMWDVIALCWHQESVARPTAQFARELIKNALFGPETDGSLPGVSSAGSSVGSLYFTPASWPRWLLSPKEPGAHVKPALIKVSEPTPTKALWPTMPLNEPSSNLPPITKTDDGRPILFQGLITGCSVQGTTLLTTFSVKATASYVATKYEELNFYKDDIIAVTAAPIDGWWSGQLVNRSRRIPEQHLFQRHLVKRI
jgi:hypothetical protein